MSSNMYCYFSAIVIVLRKQCGVFINLYGVMIEVNYNYTSFDNMCSTVKVVLVSVYCAIFLHCLKYLIFDERQDILELHYLIRIPGVMKRYMRELKRRKRNGTLVTLDFKKPMRLPTDLKYILQWNEVFSHPNDVFHYGQHIFLEHNCTYYNCYITNTQSTLLELRYFDAIVFDNEYDWDVHPHVRAPHQTYIFTAIEHSNNNEMCLPNYDNYFNLTWTYRIDSDIFRSPIQILDKNGNIIGPRINMSWIDPMIPTIEDVKSKIKNKKKAVAWFLSDCASKKSKTKQKLASSLEVSLNEVNLTLDVYGWCSKLRCPKNRLEECLGLLRKDYYFYFAFEMNLSEDYITADILHPLLNYAVPIVHGGANYSRFLPPGSYIDAVKLSGDEVVSLMVQAIKSPQIYQNYFRWHNHYTYRKAPRQNGICTVCEILNDPTRNSVVKEFRRWWYSKYDRSCMN